MLIVVNTLEMIDLSILFFLIAPIEETSDLIGLAFLIRVSAT